MGHEIKKEMFNMQINLSTKLPSPHEKNSSESCFVCVERFETQKRY